MNHKPRINADERGYFYGKRREGSKMEINEITEIIIGCAYKVINTLGAGFLEKVYENALAHELHNSGLLVLQQYPIQVNYDGIIVGDYIADLLVEDQVIVEVKTVKELDQIHMAQCINYLKATGKSVCLLINFYKAHLEFKRIVYHLDETIKADRYQLINPHTSA